MNEEKNNKQLFSELDEILEENSNNSENENRKLLLREFQPIANDTMLKFFEKERDKFLLRTHEPSIDPRGLSAIRDMAVLEYLNGRINLIKELKQEV